MILLIMLLVISGAIFAKDPYCFEKMEKVIKEQTRIIEFLEKTDLEFTETIVNIDISEIIEASYFYCNDDHGFLYVKLQDKEKLYKDVPLKTWFEFKFNDALDSYYKSQIKYNFIPV